ncbi:hypothetical protein N0V92_008838 [Colletotrichum tropicale]|nr:hypothetical protein N0V92_008838 [Colletotrichum tropicale]
MSKAASDHNPHCHSDLRCPITNISDHRCTSPKSVIELLVHWGCHAGGTTWAREKKLWDSRDHKKAVLAYWSPDGVNTRSEKLGLHPVKGPFDYDTDEEEERGPDRRTTEANDVNNGGAANGEGPDLDSDDDSDVEEEDTEGSDKEDEYLVEYVGYSPIWLPAHQVCPDAIKNWKGARVPAGGLRPLPGTGDMA